MGGASAKTIRPSESTSKGQRTALRAQAPLPSVDLTEETASAHADLNAVRSRTGVHVSLSVLGVTLISRVASEGDSRSPAAIGVTVLTVSLAATIPSMMLALLGWACRVPGPLLAMLATAVFIVVFSANTVLLLRSLYRPSADGTTPVLPEPSP
ncbi:hypothetical protein [Nonomuraea sp. NPDC048916]|uniref:hypothetical protein n=1 Tax=Nonomuraea sp. NPDC048916 TaxID=3154232 RepID=UPI0033EE9EE7